MATIRNANGRKVNLPEMNLGSAEITGVGTVEITWTNGYAGWYQTPSGAEGDVYADQERFSQ